MNSRNSDTWLSHGFCPGSDYKSWQFFLLQMAHLYLLSFLVDSCLRRQFILQLFLWQITPGEKWQDFPPTLLLIVHCWQELTDPLHLVLQVFFVNFKQLLVSTITHKFLRGLVNVSWLCNLIYRKLKGEKKSLTLFAGIGGNNLRRKPVNLWAITYFFFVARESPKGFYGIFYPFCAWSIKKKCRSLIPCERVHTTHLLRPFTIFLGNPWLYRTGGQALNCMLPGAPTATWWPLRWPAAAWSKSLRTCGNEWCVIHQSWTYEREIQLGSCTVTLHAWFAMKPTSYFDSLLAVVSNFCEGFRKLVLAAVSDLSWQKWGKS